MSLHQTHSAPTGARAVALVGCGFVADLYMPSLATFPDIDIIGCFDLNPDRMAAFATHWGINSHPSYATLLDALPAGGVILNLTNPNAHFEVTKQALGAGHHVYSEKPLAMNVDDAKTLHALAADRDLHLSSAPCSVLGEAAQTLWKAVRDGVAGTPRLVYAELDDGFIPQAPHQNWISESGAPWPSDDEFRVGCTLEHAGYYLTWLIAMFGPVRRVAAASAELLTDKGSDGTPDFSVATLFFDDGVAARLTCSILAPHDHRIRVIGDKGVLGLNAAWDNRARVTFRKRIRIRNRLMESPLARRLRISGDTHPKVGRRGAAAMNFALGPAEMLDAIARNTPPRLSANFSLHMTEVTLAIQNAGTAGGAITLTTTCDRMEPMPWAM